jgi:hypothetical protein
MQAAVRAVEEMRVPISKDDLRNLFEWVEAKIEESGCDHTLRHTQEFIRSTGFPTDKVTLGLKEYGGHCDCEVIMNVENEWGEFAGTR